MTTLKTVLGYLKSSTVKLGTIQTVNMTFILASQTEDINLTQGDPENVPFNDVEIDKIGEFDEGVFTPSKTKYYRFSINMEFGVGDDQDELKIDIYDNEAEETIFESEERSSGEGNRDRDVSVVEKLEKGVGYTIRATNSDNDDSISGKAKRTKLAIEECNYE